MEEKFGVSATSDHAYGYDTMYNALVSIEKANPERIVEQLSQLDREGVLGRFVFDQDNHEVKSGSDFIPVPSSQVQNGKMKLYGRKVLAHQNIKLNLGLSNISFTFSPRSCNRGESRFSPLYRSTSLGSSHKS